MTQVQSIRIIFGCILLRPGRVSQTLRISESSRSGIQLPLPKEWTKDRKHCKTCGKADIRILIDWHNENRTKLDPFVLAILFRHKFEKIHPFSDGNGRTGRVSMNHMLDLAGYPPMIITKRFREDYISAMNNADRALNRSLINTSSTKYEKLIEFSILAAILPLAQNLRKR